MQTSVCPSPEELKSYVRGKLDSEQSDLLSKHTLHCEACERTIVQIEAEPDTLVELLKCEISATPTPGSAPDDQRLQDQTRSSGQAASQRSDTLQLPTELGQYELKTRLGAGGMGAVYLARHKSLDKQVAIKLLPALPAQHPGFLARFQREMRAAGKLDHSAIVRTTDAGELQGIHFLVMEAIDGMDLSRIVRVEEKLSIADACEIVRQAAIGLAHAHEKGIVHRDVKPSNLMLDVNGQVRILDFGLAQVGLWDSGSAEITTVGQLMGTLDYMAPEQAERGGAVDYRADLYSLGATLFRLLTGRAPLAAAPNLTPLEKLRLLATHKPPKLRSLRVDVPEALSQIVDAMLSREPAQRPASATHAAELLEPFGAGAELIGLLSRAQSKPQVDETSFSINPLLQRDLASGSPDRNVHESRDRSESWIAPRSNVGSRRFGRWLPGAALSGSLGMMCAGVWFILETSKGQLVIDSQVDVQVKIVAVDDSGKRSDFDELQILPGSKATRLKSGKYEIVLDSASDSFGVTNGEFTIRNGQTVVATITPKTNTASSDQTPLTNIGTRPVTVDDPRLNEVVYDGETLDTWIRRLKFERNEKEVERTLKALIALADPSLRDVMLTPLMDFAKRSSHNHLGYVATSLSRLCGPSLPEISARMLAEFDDEETKGWFLTYVTWEIKDVGTHGFSEFLAEARKLLDSNSQERSLTAAQELRRLIGDIDRTKVPAGVQSQIVQTFVETRLLTDENFWLAFPRKFGDSGSAAMSNEIIKRAIDRLSDAATSIRLKSQAAIVLGSLLEEKTPSGERLKLSEPDRARLTGALSTDIAKLIAEPTQVDSDVKLPDQFADFVAAKLTFPSSLRTVGNTGRDTVASPYVLRMHLIDTCDLRESLKNELQELNRAMRQLPIGGSADYTVFESQVLNDWDRKRASFRTLLGIIIYLQSGALLDIPKEELHARFEEKLPADLANDLDKRLDLLSSHGSLGFQESDLARLPFESSTRAGLVFEKAAEKHSQTFQHNQQYYRLWMRSSGEDFLASYARALAVDQSRVAALTTVVAGPREAPGTYLPRTSLILDSHFGHFHELRCNSPDKLQPLLTFCDKAITDSDPQTVRAIAQMLNSLANSNSPNFSTECRDLVVKYLVSDKRLEFWLESTLDQFNNRQMRIAAISKAIERLTSDSNPLDVIDCQALIVVGDATKEDWKEISLDSQQKLVDVLRQQLVAAVQDRSTSAKLIQLPANFSHCVFPKFPVDVPYREDSNRKDVRTNHIILIFNLFVKSAIDLPNQARENLLPQVEALHETVAKLNLKNSSFNSPRSDSWKETVDSQYSSQNELIWHTWYTQTGVLLGKPFDELNNRPAKLATEEFERKRRFVQPGDTLAIYVPSVLPANGDPPVIQAGKSQPVTGFPVPVSKEGLIELPHIGQLVVKDLELSQVLAAIEESYTTKHNVLKPKSSPLGITVQYLLRAGNNVELRNIAGSQSVTVPTK